MNLAIVLLIHLVLPVTTEFSLLANSEDGKFTSRCLPEPPEYSSILPDVKLLPIMLEENNWASHYLATAVAGIIISEHIGHPLIFNVAGKLSRILERTAMPANRLAEKKWKDIASFDPENDGTQLKTMLDKDSHFAYANLEVWTGTKQAQMQKYIDDLGAVKGVGLIGYPAREGWFVPKWLVDRCGALAYPSWLPGRDAEVAEAFSNAGELIDLAAPKENVNMCFETGASSDCQLWVKDPKATDPQITVHVVSGYGGTFQEAVVKNNNLNAALRLHSYGDQMKYVRDSLADVKSNAACGGGVAPKAVAFYHWEPSNDLSVAEWDQLERVVLPGRKCGRKPDAESLYDWRCDFEPERLTKVRSIQISRRAPLIDQFLRKYQLSSEDMNTMLVSLEEVRGGAEAPTTHKDIFQVACTWVKSNKETWSTWFADRERPVEVPFFAFAWDPAVFFVTFICIVVVSIFWCFCFDGLFISGRGVRETWNWKLDVVPRLIPRLKPQGKKN